MASPGRMAAVALSRVVRVALSGEDFLRAVPTPGSGIEALGEPSLAVVQESPGKSEATLSGDDPQGGRAEGTQGGPAHAVYSPQVLPLDPSPSLQLSSGAYSIVSCTTAIWRLRAGGIPYC